VAIISGILVVTTRPLRAVIDRARGRVFRRGSPSLQISESEVVMERTLVGRIGSATLSIHRGDDEVRLANVYGPPETMGEVAALAILLAAWLRLRLRDGSSG
jgi:hypothetical protein